MKEFIKRNAPIFVIGAFTVIIFLIIIIVSQFRKQKSPEMKPLDNQQKVFIDTSVAEEVRATESKQVDDKFGTLEIKYTCNKLLPFLIAKFMTTPISTAS